MKKTLITLLALAGVTAAADKVQIDFGRYDAQTDGYYNIYVAEGFSTDQHTANYVNGATSATTTHSLTLGGQEITLTYAHTTEVSDCGGKGLMPTLTTTEEPGDWKNAYDGDLPSGVQGNVSDGITTQAGNGGTHTLTFSNLAAGTYTLSAFGAYYGKDAFSAITVSLGDELTANWSFQACETGTWSTDNTATSTSTVNLNSYVDAGDTPYNHGYYFTADGITVEEGASLSVTIAGKGSYGRTPLNYVSLMVPEPTTATLSLLALAGLAARRRRR